MEGRIRGAAHAVAEGLSGHDELARARGHDRRAGVPGGLMRFYREYILNLEVLPPEATKSMMQIAKDATVCRAMNVRTSFPVIAIVPPHGAVPELTLGHRRTGLASMILL